MKFNYDDDKKDLEAFFRGTGGIFVDAVLILLGLALVITVIYRLLT